PGRTLFPYTTLFRSGRDRVGDRGVDGERRRRGRSGGAGQVDSGPGDRPRPRVVGAAAGGRHEGQTGAERVGDGGVVRVAVTQVGDRKSTRLNSSHVK